MRLPPPALDAKGPFPDARAAPSDSANLTADEAEALELEADVAQADVAQAAALAHADERRTQSRR